VKGTLDRVSGKDPRSVQELPAELDNESVPVALGESAIPGRNSIPCFGATMQN
jgi:hypothetical protein